MITCERFFSSLLAKSDQESRQTVHKFQTDPVIVLAEEKKARPTWVFTEDLCGFLETPRAYH